MIGFSNGNHMAKRMIWNKSKELFFINFEINVLEQGRFHTWYKNESDLSQISQIAFRFFVDRIMQRNMKASMHNYIYQEKQWVIAKQRVKTEQQAIT